MKRYRVYRGGSWSLISINVRFSDGNNRLTPGARAVDLGFRMVRGLR